MVPPLQDFTNLVNKVSRRHESERKWSESQRIQSERKHPDKKFKSSHYSERWFMADPVPIPENQYDQKKKETDPE